MNKKKQLRTSKWTKVKYIIVYHILIKKYGQDSYSRGFKLCFHENITSALNTANAAKRPGTSIFVYKVNNVGKVKSIVDWGKNL
jgi:hypothetical protein